MSDEHPITLNAAAKEFGFTVPTLRAEADRGRLAVYKIGRRLYTDRSAVENLTKPLYGRRKIEHTGAGVYVIGFLDYVKIGWSDDLERRLSTIRRSLPEQIKVHAALECHRKNERILHRQFAKYRTRGEWFRHEGELAQWIKGGCTL